MAEPSHPIAACLTPPGSAAIAVIAVRGPGVWEIVTRLFKPRSGALPSPEQVRIGQFWFGRFGDGLADQVVLAVKRLTPTPWLEVQCHGGREVVAWLLEQLTAAGVRERPWPELEPAAGILSQAPTVRTAAVLLDQVQGAFARQVETISSALRSGDTAGAGGRLAELARFEGVGRHLVTPWRVVVAGAVNAGKSSLVNALAGYQRSVVTPVPGTTRDVVTVRVAVDGWPVELADTAGLRPNAKGLEQQGMTLARTAAAEADLCLWVVDASTQPLWPERNDAMVVVNKSDLPSAWDVESARGVRVSALSGAGLAELCQAIADRVVPEAPPPGTPVPFTPELCDAITETRRCLARDRPDEALAILDRIKPQAA